VLEKVIITTFKIRREQENIYIDRFTLPENI